ncbi:ABC transporter substrate-binding protein [Propionibacteriaceae bacterium Y2011]
MSPSFSRCRLLGAGVGTATLGAIGGLAACDGGGQQEAAGSGKLVWWDQYLPKAELERKTFATFHADGGPEVEYTVYNPNEQGKAVQLAKQSNQMPDVFTLAGLQTAAVVLQEGGWFAPLSNPDAIKANIDPATLIEGMNTFDGEMYSFPLNSARTCVTLPWGNKSMLEKADIDPTAKDGQSWDDFRANVRQGQDKVGKPGLLLNLAFAPRMAEFVHDLAQQAGFPGGGGMEYATGAYHYHHQAYLDVFDFLLSFQQDKLLLPASSTLDARKGRARRAAGDAVWFIDGPFNAGVVKTDFGGSWRTLWSPSCPPPAANPRS